MFGKKTSQSQPFRKAGLYIAPAEGKPQGLFCIDPIKAGETIEIAPLMIFSAEENAQLQKTRLAGFIRDAAPLPRGLCIREKVRQPRGAQFIIIGAAAYCNQRTQANAATSFEDGIVAGLYVLKAVKDISPDTEICIGI